MNQTQAFKHFRELLSVNARQIFENSLKFCFKPVEFERKPIGIFTAVSIDITYFVDNNNGKNYRSLP